MSVSLLFQLQQTIEAKKSTPPPAPQIEFYQVAMERVDVSPFGDIAITLSCDSGDLATGGGFALGSLNMVVLRNEPDNNAASWFRARANCIKVSQ
jgi:hypothetical protein